MNGITEEHYRRAAPRHYARIDAERRRIEDSRARDRLLYALERIAACMEGQQPIHDVYPQAIETSYRLHGAHESSRAAPGDVFDWSDQ